MLHYQWPDDLLELAARIATLDPGRPRQVSMRRSVSTAYYALFQALGATVAVDLVSGSDDVKARVWRAVDHGAVRRLLTNAEFLRAADRKLVRIGAIFKGLQELRHAADYDPRPFPVGRNRVLELIVEGREALNLLRSLGIEQKRSLASHLLSRTR